jgi:hypothetical protein
MIDQIEKELKEIQKGSGGTEGGIFLFVTGFLLSFVGLWFFLSNVNVSTGSLGFFSGLISRSGFNTTSTGIVFVPMFLGVLVLFYNANLKWAWLLFYAGLGLIVIEILSRIQFLMNIKTSHLIMMLGMMAAGIGMMIRSFKDYSKV